MAVLVNLVMFFSVNEDQTDSSAKLDSFHRL